MIIFMEKIKNINGFFPVLLLINSFMTEAVIT